MSVRLSDADQKNRKVRILVLGGYGHFGGRICRALATDATIQLIIAGRSEDRARMFCENLRGAAHPPRPLQIDLAGPDWEDTLQRSGCNIVINTCGPFQGQDFKVARACATAGIHYVDLADSREFVCGITALDDLARDNNCLIVSGASSVPALSSAVIARLAEGLDPESISIVIAPGQKTQRGLATIRSVMSYCGQALEMRGDAGSRTPYGWQGLRRIKFRFLPPRLSAYCDVPDLDLLPRSYPNLQRVEFRAALELGIGHLGFWLLASLRRIGLIRDVAAWAPTIQKIANWLDVFGTDISGMRVDVSGRQAGTSVTKSWELLVGDGQGPEIPCIPAIIVARRLAAGTETRIGAMPCTGMMTLDEFDRETADLNLHWEFDNEAKKGH